MLNENVVEYRERPMSIVTIDGRDYLPLKTFCDMTGLKADNRIFDTMEVIERPATGRQRKPRRYITVDAWIELWKRAFYTWLEMERAPEEEILTPWPWYGVKRVAFMMDMEPKTLIDALVDKGYLRLPEKSELAVVKRDFILTFKGEATEWLRYRMRVPSPLGSWKAAVLIDMSHPDFIALVASSLHLDGADVFGDAIAAIEEAHNERESIWRKRHPWIVRMREYEAAAEADSDLDAIMQAHPGAFESIR